ncbi:hypothetical protein JCM10207_003153 [Rhodosporidiobolus poonsookiae]
MPLDPSQSLLRWGIENAQPGAIKDMAEQVEAGRRPDLNTDILKSMMGVSDADRMLECIQVIEGHWVDRDGTGEVKNSSDITDDDRYRAWDDLEMLIEDLDNANNLKAMNLWAPIVKHLTDADDEVVKRACWVCGTAVQNNPSSQNAFLETDPLPTISSLVASTSASAGTRAKAMYCLSSTLKHSEPAVQRFGELDGFSTLTQTLQDPSLTLRAKTAFLLSQLMSQSSSPSTLVSSLRSASTLSTLIDSLHPSTALPTGSSGEVEAIDPDFRDKGLRFLANVVERTSGADGLNGEEKEKVQKVVGEVEKDAEWTPEDIGMAQDEWKAFKDALKA